MVVCFKIIIILCLKVPNVNNHEEVIKIIQAYIAPIAFYPYNVYINFIYILFTILVKYSIVLYYY